MGAPLSSWPVCLACLGLFPKVVKHLMTKRIIFGDSMIRLKSLVAKYHVVLNGCASQYGPGVELKLRIFIRSVLTSPGRWQTLDNLQLWTQPIAHFTHCPLSCTLCVNFRAEFITTNIYVHCEHGSATHCMMAAYIGKWVGAAPLLFIPQIPRRGSDCAQGCDKQLYNTGLILLLLLMRWRFISIIVIIIISALRIYISAQGSLASRRPRRHNDRGSAKYPPIKTFDAIIVIVIKSILCSLSLWIYCVLLPFYLIVVSVLPFLCVAPHIWVWCPAECAHSSTINYSHYYDDYLDDNDGGDDAFCMCLYQSKDENDLMLLLMVRSSKIRFL